MKIKNSFDYTAATTFFKVWDGKRIYYVDDNEEHGLYEVRICKGEWELYEIGLYDNFDNFVAGSNQLSKLMKCTGLKDNSGYWVYEGDIMSVGDNIPSIVRYGEHNCLGFYLEEPSVPDITKRKVHRFGKKDDYPRFHDFFFQTNIPSDWIIKGNIYSDPEFYNNY